MKQPKYKSFTDPVHGFIGVPHGPLMALLQAEEVQRLRRIRQLGVGHMVFPGAEHSRFGHALGAMALMEQVVATLRAKGTEISTEEETAALAVALLHDVGHGPFSHTLEHALIAGFSHELMSRELIVRLADRFGEPLDLALQFFDDVYPRRFFHQLISSQLDMDRLDYLRRDTYYTGVVEGAVGVDRIVRNLRVHPDDESGTIVVDHKGLHAVENFLMSRRLMYWQVYLHKAVVAGDQLLRATLRRARHRLGHDDDSVRSGSPALCYFLERVVSRDDVTSPEVVDRYISLDDSDILYSLKRWSHCTDPILSDLSRRFLVRQFPRVTFLDAPPEGRLVETLTTRVLESGLVPSVSPGLPSSDVASYYFAIDSADHAAYESKLDSIKVISATGRVIELSQVADAASVGALSTFEKRWYVCLPKEVDTSDLNLS